MSIESWDALGVVACGRKKADAKLTGTETWCGYLVLVYCDGSTASLLASDGRMQSLESALKMSPSLEEHSTASFR